MMDLLKFLQTVPPNYKVSIVKDMRMPATFKHNCVIFVFEYYRDDDLIYKKSKAYDLEVISDANYSIADMLEEDFKYFRMAMEEDPHEN